jgi:uncharacterized membrane protein YfhO
LNRGLNGKLVFSQPDYPGWKVFVDGIERPTKRYDIFMSIDIAEADRAVVFAYRPPWIYELAIMALLIVLADAALFVADRRPRSATVRYSGIA